ncbi:Hydroxyacid oxidase 1 [Halotydeus destructor]|nr:Hydroxyacid oxidase 1 [Halotydeus destructor]
MISVSDFEAYALQHLDKKSCDYYRSGANAENTLRENTEAFQRLRIKPRFLERDVSKRSTETTFLGSTVPFPIGVSPTALQRMAHPDGELATARACEELGTVMILSTMSTTSLEDVARAAPKLAKWFQLNICQDRSVTKRLLARAEKAGFAALVITVDVPYIGVRWADVKNKFTLPPHLTLANLEDEIVHGTKIPGAPGVRFFNSYFDPGLTWRDVDWVREQTKLPVLVKGILTAEDAMLAVEHRVSGIIVSNHGARQLDGVPATIEVLPEIVRAVGGHCEVFVDGGFREGTDVLKALALGARGVFVGRPVLWGLSHSGKNGVKQVLEILSKEFDAAMALSGCCETSHIKRELVAHKDSFSKL